jgi:hypothetical protein
MSYIRHRIAKNHVEFMELEGSSITYFKVYLYPMFLAEDVNGNDLDL